MNIRGIVERKLGSRIFVRPADCTCDQCPRVDLTQARLQTDIDAINVGDKIESYTGSLWYKVDSFTPNPQLDALDAAFEELSSLFGGNMPTYADQLDEDMRTNIRRNRRKSQLN